MRSLEGGFGALPPGAFPGERPSFHLPVCIPGLAVWAQITTPLCAYAGYTSGFYEMAAVDSKFKMCLNRRCDAASRLKVPMSCEIHTASPLTGVT